MSLTDAEHRPTTADHDRARPQRLSPQQAAVEVERGAVLVDIRSIDERRRQGDVPGARTAGLARLDIEHPGRRTILLSASGRRAAFAATDLERRGILVGFVAGGVRGWEAAGLAVRAYRHGQITSAPSGR